MRKQALSALPVMETKKKGRLVGVRIDGDTLVLDCWSGGKYQGRYCIRENGEYMSFVNGVWQQQKLCDVLSGVHYRGYYSYAENGRAFDEAQQKMAEQFFDKIKSRGYSIESSANYAESDFMAEKRRRREQRRIERINKRMDEVPVLPDGFEGWVKAVPFEGKQFLFKGKREDEYICTACGKTHRMKNLKQNQAVVCSRTGQTVKVDKKRSQRASSCHVMVMQWMNEEKDERVARHLLVECLWDTKGQHIETCEQVRYVLKSTGCNEWYYGQRYSSDEFSQRWDEKNPKSFHCYREYCYPEGVKELLSGTVYENIGIPEMAAKGWAVWYNKLMISPSSCHVMEYLVKGGYQHLTEEISANIYWGSDCVNYHGSTLQEVLKIDKQRANRLRQANGGMRYLRWMQWELRTGRRLTEETVRWLQKHNLGENDLSFIEDQMSPEQVMHYLDRQAKESGKGVHWLLNEWKDTLRMAKQCKMDVTDAIVYRPRDLIVAHDRLVQRINRMNAEQQEREYNKKYPGITKVCRSLKKYEWTDGVYSVVAPTSVADILAEGRVLNHCVTNDRYFERLAKEESYILFLRKAKTPDVPWYTLEIEPGGVIRQKRTKFNRQEKDLDAAKDFLKRWQQEVIRRVGERERGLQKASAAARAAEIAQLRRDGVVVHGGELTGTLLADVLLADLMDVSA